MTDEPTIPGQTTIEVEGEVVAEGEGEIVISQSVGTDTDGERTIRVYDRGRGDFTLTIPNRSSVTFGYFNPAAPKYAPADGYSRSRPSDVAAATALRIYERGPKSSQLACFLDVQGFRDLSLKLTRLRQRVVIESNFEDDGDGNKNWHGMEGRQLVPKNEDDEIPF